VADNGEIQWNATGKLFQVFLQTGEGEIVDVIANVAPAAPGSSFRPQGGTYILNINPLGSWAIRVAQIAPNSTPTSPADGSSSTPVGASQRAFREPASRLGGPPWPER
jgi:hypothetical protein